MNKKIQNQKGFTFRLSDEKLKEFAHLSPEEKLEWLEEANKFVNQFVSKEKRELFEKLKQGEL